MTMMNQPNMTYVNQYISDGNSAVISLNNLYAISTGEYIDSNIVRSLSLMTWL